MDNVLKIYLLIYKVEKKIRADFSEWVRTKNIPLTFDQWMILSFVNGAKELSQSELCHITAKDKASISRICKDLISKGFLQSYSKDSNLRKSWLKVTALGEKLLVEIKPFSKQTIKRFETNYFEREYNTMYNLLERFLQ